MQDIKRIILNQIKKNSTVSSEDIAKTCNVSRQAAHMHLRDLVKRKRLIRIGRTRGAYYVLYSEKKAKKLHEQAKRYHAKLKNDALEEDRIYDRVTYAIPPIRRLRKNTQEIMNYAFTEMLNNAIEHSGSEYIDITLVLDIDGINFEVTDKGIGIFRHIHKKFGLKDEYEALTELLKGKKTTSPSKHTGEGIFFTSKISDIFQIESSRIKVIMDNTKNDIYTEEISFRKGTKIYFQINKSTKKNLGALFDQYTDSDYQFQKTKVTVKLYHSDVRYISRSQARRLLAGLNSFRIVVLDFNKVKTIGQGFADEIFRVFKNRYPDIKIEPINCCKAVEFMIGMVKTE